MKNDITRLLNGESGSHVFPFFWLRNEEESLIREYVNVVHSAGIREVCVESRGHVDFCGEKWWRDMDAIMDEAQKLGMRVWVLDDARFPTGYANGAVLKQKNKGKLYINYGMVEVIGPISDIEIPIAALGQNRSFGPTEIVHGNPVTPETDVKGDIVIAVLAVRIQDGDEGVLYIDLTNDEENGRLFWNVPAGVWRVYVVYETRSCGGRPGYINLLDKESVQLLIDSVYQPHYERYKHSFGESFAGFFSDEPGIGNILGYASNTLPGQREMPLPWSREMGTEMEKRLGQEWKAMLPMLWHPCVKEYRSAKTRAAFMDAVSTLASKNFSRNLGEWCRERNVMYVGHVIEDNGLHARLGCGFPHFFRAQAGQDYAGVDCIGWQVTPGAPYTTRHGLARNEGLFNHFALAKLAASAAQIDPLKQGRAFCEIYGAFGWRLGVDGMHWLLNHFLVRGVNKYVPHAFSLKEFPDPECPPHFYAHGNHAQFPWFSRLMVYANRVCTLLDGAKNHVPVAVLYNVEGEWAGEYMPIEKPARVLAESQIDYHFVPVDALNHSDVRGHELEMNGIKYQALVIPYSKYISGDLANFIRGANKFTIYFIDSLPDEVLDGSPVPHCQCIPLGELADKLLGVGDVAVNYPFPDLRYGRWKKDSGEMWMFFNESGNETFDGSITLPKLDSPVGYDAFNNRLLAINCECEGNGCKLQLRLEPGEVMFVLSGCNLVAPATDDYQSVKIIDCSKGWAVNLKYPSGSGNNYFLDELSNIARLEPNYSGTIEYEKILTLPDCDGLLVKIGECHDMVSVFVDDVSIGMSCRPPFIFEHKCKVVAGEHSLRIVTANTPQRHVAGLGHPPSIFAPPEPLMPVGLMGSVAVEVLQFTNAPPL